NCMRCVAKAYNNLYMRLDNTTQAAGSAWPPEGASRWRRAEVAKNNLKRGLEACREIGTIPAIHWVRRWEGDDFSTCGFESAEAGEGGSGGAGGSLGWMDQEGIGAGQRIDVRRAAPGERGDVEGCSLRVEDAGLVEFARAIGFERGGGEGMFGREVEGAAGQ